MIGQAVHGSRELVGIFDGAAVEITQRVAHVMQHRTAELVGRCRDRVIGKTPSRATPLRAVDDV